MKDYTEDDTIMDVIEMGRFEKDVLKRGVIGCVTDYTYFKSEFIW